MEEMTAKERAAAMAGANVLSAQIQAKALDALRPITLAMQREGWPADGRALMWRAISRAALENARKQEGRHDGV